MTASIINGKEVSQEIRAGITEEVKQLSEQGLCLVWLLCSSGKIRHPKSMCEIRKKLVTISVLL